MRQDEGKIFYEKATLERSCIKNIGFVFDESLYLPYFSAKEYLEFVFRLIGMEPKESKANIDKVTEAFNLPADRQPISAYSNGMKGKVSVAAAIIHSPEFLILDEPFSGINFITTREIINILKKGRCSYRYTSFLCTQGLARFAAGKIICFLKKNNTH